jgi:hypothetical protein
MLSFSFQFSISISISIAFLAALALAHDGHDRGDEHVEPCACVAKELGFVIDCKNQTAISTAYKTLMDKSCNRSAQCKVDAACKQAYFLVQAHHDHCLSDEVPKDVEGGLHMFEAFCEGCTISKQFTPSRAACPKVACNASADFTAAHAYLNANNCSTACGSLECGAKYQLIRAAHDTCEHDDVPQEVEVAIHEFEDACAAQECNTVAAAFTPTCTDEHDHDHEDDEGTKGATTAAPTSDAHRRQVDVSVVTAAALAVAVAVALGKNKE